MFGSRRSWATAASIDAGENTVSVAGVDLTPSAAGAGGDSKPISAASATALTRKCTTKLLLDVPRLEFNAPIQIQSKTGGDVKRLQKADDGRVFDGADPRMARPPYRLQITPRVGVRVRRKPNLQKKHAGEQRELRDPKNLRRGTRDAAMSRGELTDPTSQLGPAKALELNDGLRERPGRRQPAQREGAG